jgi:hypothetical protein
LGERVITATAELTANWFEEVLKESGDLQSGAVAAFRVEPLGSENSSIVRIRLDYAAHSTGTLPAKLLLKMCGGDHSHAFGSSEVDYYRRDYVGRANLPLVKCYSAVYSAEKQSYHLLLEDLTETYRSNRENISTGEHGYAVAEGLGALHACWWSSASNQPAGLDLPGPAKMAKYFRHMQPGPALLLAEIKAELDGPALELGQTLAELLPARLIERAKNPNGFTLVHGDVNPGNILSPLSGVGPTYLIDRQPFDWSLTTWLGVSDLAYMMVLWWNADFRRQHEVKVLQTYYASLLVNGVTGYSWEQLWQDYRLAVMQCIYIPFEWCLLETDRINMRWLWEMEFRRVLTATQDLNCRNLLNP